MSEDLFKACLGCLLVSDQFKYVNETVQFDKEVLKIAYVIEKCIGLKIKKDVSQAQVLCLECVHKLAGFHEFRQQFLKCASFCCDESQLQADKTDFDESEETSNDYGNGYIGVDEDSIDDTDHMSSGQLLMKIKTEPELEINDVYENSIELEDGTRFIVTETEGQDDNSIGIGDGDEEESGSTSNTSTNKPKLHDRKLKKDYFCTFCNKTMHVTYYRFQYHLRIHDPHSAFQCQYCGKRFTCKNELRIHIPMHTGQKPFQCKMCGYKTSTAYLLKMHAKVHNDGNVRLKCESCDFTTNFSSNLLRHKQRLHAVQERFECDICGKSYKFKMDLKYHYRVHNPEQLIYCDVCNKGFPKPSKMLSHRKIHFKHRPDYGQAETEEII